MLTENEHFFSSFFATRQVQIRNSRQLKGIWSTCETKAGQHQGPLQKGLGGIKPGLCGLDL